MKPDRKKCQCKREVGELIPVDDVTDPVCQRCGGSLLPKHPSIDPEKGINMIYDGPYTGYNFDKKKVSIDPKAFEAMLKSLEIDPEWWGIKDLRKALKVYLKGAR